MLRFLFLAFNFWSSEFELAFWSISGERLKFLCLCHHQQVMIPFRQKDYCHILLTFAISFLHDFISQLKISHVQLLGLRVVQWIVNGLMSCNFHSFNIEPQMLGMVWSVVVMKVLFI